MVISRGVQNVNRRQANASFLTCFYAVQTGIARDDYKKGSNMNFQLFFTKVSLSLERFSLFPL